MENPTFYITIALSSLTAVAMISVVGLKGFSSWIELKRAELTAHQPSGDGATLTGNRIEMADLKERLRKLEAIAAGVDL